MATKSLIINSTAQNGKKLQKSITNVNPACSNEDAGTFAQKLNALTTNTYQSAGIVKKMDVTEEDQGGGATPTVKLYVNKSGWQGNLSPNVQVIENGVRISVIDDADDNLGYVDVTYTLE